MEKDDFFNYRMPPTEPYHQSWTFKSLFPQTTDNVFFLGFFFPVEIHSMKKITHANAHFFMNASHSTPPPH